MCIVLLLNVKHTCTSYSLRYGFDTHSLYVAFLTLSLWSYGEKHSSHKCTQDTLIIVIY